MKYLSASLVMALTLTGAALAARNNPPAASFQVLGPFYVSYNDPGVGDDFVPVATLPAGAQVLDAWAYIPETFATNPPGDGHTLAISLGQGTGYLKRYDGFTSNPDPNSEPASLTVLHRVQRVGSGQQINVEIYPGQGVFVSGRAEVYALISGPA